MSCKIKYLTYKNFKTTEIHRKNLHISTVGLKCFFAALMGQYPITCDYSLSRRGPKFGFIPEGKFSDDKFRAYCKKQCLNELECSFQYGKGML